MLDPKEILFGLSIKYISQSCDVDLTTARRWKRGAICPPQSALAVLSGDLGFLDPAWRGWRLKDGHLLSPESWELSMGDVLASRLHEAQLAAWRKEVRDMKALVAEYERGGYEDQPTPDSWDVQILTG
jgi:hypothetical protein